MSREAEHAAAHSRQPHNEHTTISDSTAPEAIHDGQQVRPDSTRKVITMTLMVTALMFGFGFALVPLYDVFCKLTGINGKTNDQYEITEADLAVDESRQVKIQFITSNNENMVWDFKPVVTEVKVHPGEVQIVNFKVHNPTDRPMVAQAVPSLSPSEGTSYFHKIECFCFNQQHLNPGESALMPLQFMVDKDLPDYLVKLTLSYTLFDQTPSEAPPVAVTPGNNREKPPGTSSTTPDRTPNNNNQDSDKANNA